MRRGDYSKADRSRYLEYIGSPAWARRKRRALDRAGRRCQYEREGEYGGWSRCPRVRYLTVHHLSYARLGCEADEDLEVLCWFHHMVEHMMWQECEACGEPVPGTYAAAEAWLAEVLAAEGVDLDRPGPVDWSRLPAKPLLESLLPDCPCGRSGGRG